MRVKHETISLRPFLTSCHERRIFVALKKTRDLGICQECIHAFKEAGVQDVGFIHDETNFFALATGSAKDSSKIFVEVCSSILIGYLDLVDTEAIHPRNKAR